MESPAVTNFREYIKIKTVQPIPDYKNAVIWLKKQAEELNANFQVQEFVTGKPVVVISITGKEPQLSTILLNSHIDVVPVFEDQWKYDPFAAVKEENGDIYGRGTQDMKCVGVQYLEAMKQFKKEGLQMLRTIHISFVPDEEIGGVDGMKTFVQTDEFKSLNVSFALDEGYASTDDSFFIFYGERNIWQFFVRCPGPPGHGSQFLRNTAGQKLRVVLDEFMAFREKEEKRLKDNPQLDLGDVTTVNLTLLQGGVQFNVVPSELSLGFDVRITPTVNLAQFEDMLLGWCKKAGDDVYLDFDHKDMPQDKTVVEDGKNIWWDSFRTACEKENLVLKKRIFPAGTDSRYVRECGIPAIGFSPINNTPLLLHDHNEFLNEKVFLRGIEIYKTIIKEVANLEL